VEKAKKGYTTTKSVDKLTKRELLELANFLYSRYEHKKKDLNNTLNRATISSDTSHVKAET
jgi:hypothetical protein